jgi:RHS repeat-associated protein
VRGFIGQEELPDHVCLVNLNARLYDQQIGRFLSADPTVESVYDGQDLNRYSYAGNNPLAFADPSGLCFMGCFYKSPVFGAALDLGLFFFGLPELEALTTITSISGTATTAYAAASAANLTVINAGIAGGLSGAVTSGRLKGALLGAAQGVAMQGVAPGLGHALGTVIANPVADSFIAHGFVGGLFNIGQKGGFASGFIAAGVGSLNAPIPLDQFSTGLEMASLGGAASVLGGGKFANGAVTAAFSYEAGILSGANVSFECKSGQACQPALQTDRISGLFRIGNLLSGDVLVQCMNAGGNGNCGTTVGQMKGIDHTYADGYGISLNIRVATLWDELWSGFTGKTMVQVFYEASDHAHDGQEASGIIELYPEANAQTPPHELGHALGATDNMTDRSSVMFYEGIPNRNSFPNDAETRALVNAYPSR